MKRDISLFIKDIHEYMIKAEALLENMSFEDFMRDERTLLAVERCFGIIGEASKNVPDKIRHRYPKISWKKMAGLRDKLSHFYFGINHKRVWSIIKEDIPLLKDQIKAIIVDMESESEFT
ncbi:MAG: DUF86 domain-containing protein [Nitrospirae bacterium]|nr:DUF86 domain-containing protein [Nitrospirota bacterium]